MKALILAAGLGTRLLPYTQAIPKPLFTLMSSPMLEHIIQKLVDTGCKQIVINTHHLHEQIKDFVMQNRYCDIIHTIHEPVILDTGGAIANAKPFLENHPFFVINSDIISNINLKKAYNFHEQSNCLATLVLHDHDQFNKVKTDDFGYIQDFDAKTRGLAFTGVQILSPKIFARFPDKKIFSSIEVYKNLCKTKQVKALVDKNIFWSDIGTKNSYSMTSLLLLAASQFKIDQGAIKNIQVDRLAGDGSDRNWYRVKYGDSSLIISDHGICMPESDELLQINAFINIGNHLSLKEIPVPQIYNFDKLSGNVILEDLGDINLETRIKEKKSDEFTLKLYKKVIDELIGFSIKGFIDFNKEWTCQTQTYSKELILEKECGYFIKEFIQDYMKLNFSFNDFSKEFNHIADNALKYGFIGLMHRDMQSRNIMVKNNRVYFIDFQGARSGPLQYDLASLLIDPYVNLKDKIRDKLLKYVMEKLKLSQDKKGNFLQCYHYCSLTRNMQFLGTFSFLSQIKKREKFEQYIPDSIQSLKQIITDLNMDNKIPKLSKLTLSI
ncbi:MAG: sugar phosphate nucleotidyltransferase [Deltaproteobacteria bacterium]|jgi:NDP-sugar pyrophosphorylase family protein/tRNA A-37 threonylcarbamoyl transferase component Bud32|nr:sugar phosphate nucleotidyltransferase [Deltaproteobacteria bacterium]